MVAKAGLGLIGLSAISVGGVALTNPGWLGMNHSATWNPLFKDNGFDTKNTGSGEYSNKFGGKNKNYLVGLDETNKDWWIESFNRWQGDFAVGSERKSSLGKIFKEKIDKAFKVVTFPDSSPTDNNKYLNHICHAIYKSAETEIPASTPSDDSKYKEDDVWRYCSPLGKKPATIEKSETNDEWKDDSNKIGGDKKTQLISVSNKDNKLFWDIKDDEFYGRNAFTGKAKTVNSSSHKYFEAQKKTGKPISEFCQAAYGMPKGTTTSATDKPTPDEVVNFCAFD